MHEFFMTQGGPLLVLCQYFKGQGLIRTRNFLQFPHDFSITFLHTIIILHTWVSSSWPKEDLYWFLGHLVKGQGQIRTLNFANFPHYNYYLLNSWGIHVWSIIIVCQLNISYRVEKVKSLKSKFDLLTPKLIEVALKWLSAHVWSIINVCHKEMTLSTVLKTTQVIVSEQK